MPYPETSEIDEIIKNSQQVLIVQADNPDADSLGSALALEQIMGNMQKEVFLYCSVDIPQYLRYMRGWERVSKDFPRIFDTVIIVDASTMTLLEKFNDPNTKGILFSKSTLVLDHHAITDNPIPFANTVLNDGNRSSTGELIYALAIDLGWPVDVVAGEFMMNSILGDTQGLSNELTKPETHRIIANLMELGVNRQLLEEGRKEYNKMPEPIFRYKADLIKRTEFYDDGKVAIVSIPQNEINEFSPLYNPAPLIQNDILQTAGVQIAIVLKYYDTGRITAAIRSNYGYAVAGALAEHFGGGGHHYASGFKIDNGQPYNEIKSECIMKASELLSILNNVKHDETI